MTEQQERDALPPLPEPLRHDWGEKKPIPGGYMIGTADIYTADQMRDFARAALAAKVPAGWKLIGYYHKAESGNALEDDFYFADAINGDCPSCHPCYIDASVAVHPTPVQWRVPDGWKLVPGKPTRGMLDAGADAGNHCDWSDMEPIWAAMLAAAPAAQATPAQAQQAEPHEVDIVRAAVAAMPHANAGLADDLLSGFTMHTEMADVVAIYRAGMAATPAPANHAPGYCKHCKQYTIEEPLPAPAQAQQAEAKPHPDTADAERYRWLRERYQILTKEMPAKSVGLDLHRLYVNTREKLDAAIDAARGIGASTGGGNG